MAEKFSSFGYTPQQVANFFLDKADQDSFQISQLKLMKLVYIAYGWTLALAEKRLFDEPIEAWQHGPVIDSLYHEFKHFGSKPISGRSTEFDYDTFESIEPRISKEDIDALKILEKVWSVYKGFKAWDLRNKTHEVGGPWHKVYKRNVKGTELKDSDIKEHYFKRITDYIEASRQN